MSAEVRRAEQRPLLSGRTPEGEFLFPDNSQGFLILESLRPNPFTQKVPVLLVRSGREEPEVAFWQKESKGRKFTPLLLNDFKESSGLKVGGIVIRVGSLSEDFFEAVWEIVGKLPENSGMWFLEKRTPLADQERREREVILEAWGLVKRKVVAVRGTPFSLWYGRTEKQAKKEGSDLTVKPWFGLYLRGGLESLRESGWREIDLGEAIDACRQSRFPPLDLSNLRLGFGAKVSAPCGCRWYVDRRGGWERIKNCGIEDCEGIPPKPVKPKEKVFWVGLNIPTEVVLGREMICGQCGERLVFDRVIKSSSQKETRVISDLKCPHCGLIGPPRTLVVSSETKIVNHQA